MTFDRPQLPTASELDLIQIVTGMTLSKSTRNVYLRLAGFRALGNGIEFAIRYPDGTDSDDLLQRFMLAEDISNQWPYIGYLNDFAAHFELGPEYVDVAALLPLADCADGALYLANSGVHQGRIYYADNGDFGIALLTQSISELEALLNLSAA